MQTVPVKDLKDTVKISRLCHETGEPIHVTKNGYRDMVIMSAQAYDELERAAYAGRIVALVQEGVDAVQRGECKDAFEAVARLRASNSKWGH